MARLARSLGRALQRSLDGIKEETARAMRMEVSPNSSSEGVLHMWSLRRPEDLQNFATGSDKDIGGLSTCALSVQDGRGRFYGTVTSDIPRGSRIERSGYAAFRNKNRPTLFGSQTWDTTVHPLLALRVRDRFASAASAAAAGSEESAPANPSLRQALHASGRSPIETRAIHALGIGLKEPPGPKFFVNIQTDGPVTSDLFQHRLYLDPRLGDEWQTVLIPLDDFVLTNTGQVAPSQITMMRERIRTVGISVVLEAPLLEKRVASGAKPGATPASLRKSEEEGSSGSDSSAAGELQEDDFGRDGVLQRDAQPSGAQPTRRRGRTFNFDLGIESVAALGSLDELDAEKL